MEAAEGAGAAVAVRRCGRVGPGPRVDAVVEDVVLQAGVLKDSGQHKVPGAERVRQEDIGRRQRAAVKDRDGDGCRVDQAPDSAGQRGADLVGGPRLGKMRTYNGTVATRESENSWADAVPRRLRAAIRSLPGLHEDVLPFGGWDEALLRLHHPGGISMLRFGRLRRQLCATRRVRTGDSSPFACIQIFFDSPWYPRRAGQIRDLPARRARAAFSAASASRVLKWPFQHSGL